MAIKKIQDYKSINFKSFPSERGEVHRDKKTAWYISYMSSMMHRYVTGVGCELRYNWNYLSTLEKYAKGTQGNRKVKEKLLRYNKKTNKFTGRMKDVFETFDILPEMIDIILANNMKADYKPQSIAVDENSIKDRNLEISMMKFVLEKDTQDFLNWMNFKPDVQLTDDEIANFTSADIDILYKTGGIQMERERACVSVCNTSMLYSGHKEIENQNSFDAITYGICAVKVYWDYIENAAKYRYVDVKNLIIPSSKYNDFRDKTYAGEIRMMTLSEIISECGDIDEKTIVELVLANASYNQDFPYGSDELNNYCHGRNDIFDEYRIAVLDAQWLATDVEVYMQSPTKTGGEIYKKVAEDFRITPSKARRGNKLDKKQYIKKYYGKWVIGSEILLDYGQAENVTYEGKDGNKKPRLDYCIMKTGRKSLVDRARTIVDDINLAIAKLRSAIATLPPAPRMVIYDHALQNIRFGGILQSPKDLFDGFSEDGVLVVNGLDRNGKPYTSNGGKAVEFMSSGLAEDITIFSNEAAQKVNMLRQVIGLPEGLDGTAGQKYQLASTMNLAAAGSSNALYPTLSLIGPLYENTFDTVIPLWQLQCRDKDLNIKNINLSERVIEMFKIGKNFSNHEFKIKMLFAPTEAEKELLLQRITEASAMYTQTEGRIGVSQAEFFMLYKLIKAGLIDEAMTRIAKIEELRTKANIALQQANSQSIIEGQQQSAKMAEEERRKTSDYASANKRKDITLGKAFDAIQDAYNAVVSSQGDKPVNNQAAANIIEENKQIISNIVATDQELLQPEEQEEPLNAVAEM